MQTAIYAKWTSPIGAQALGPRYLLVITPLLALLLEPRAMRSLEWRIPAMGLLALSLCVQIINVSVKPQPYWNIREYAVSKQRDAQWVVNLKLFMHKWEGKPEKYELTSFGIDSSAMIDQTKARSLEGFNFWWLRVKWLRSLPTQPAFFAQNAKNLCGQKVYSQKPQFPARTSSPNSRLYSD